MSSRLPILILLPALMGLAGCDLQSTHEAGKSSPPAIDQERICEVSAWQRDVVANDCMPGQKVVFLPRTFGNEQLPILFAAVNCDLRYQIALTTGAVTCIYHPIAPVRQQ